MNLQEKFIQLMQIPIKSQTATDGIVIHNYGKIYGGATGVEKTISYNN